jgi:hypothetical protein
LVAEVFTDESLLDIPFDPFCWGGVFLEKHPEEETPTAG